MPCGCCARPKTSKNSADMATRSGFPAIPTPRALELRAVQQTVDNIRERFQAVETLLNQTAAIVGASTTGQTLQALQTQINNLITALSVLQAQVAAETVSVASVALAMDSRIHAVAQSYVVPGPDSANSVIANRVFRA